MNPAALLALISDLYTQVTAMNEENQQLRAERDEARAARDEAIKLGREVADVARTAAADHRPAF